MSDRKSTCESFYDRIASRYDSIYSLSDPYWRFYFNVTWENLKKYLPRDQNARILDAGGGTGLWGLKLAKSGYHVVISDISRNMLDVARHKAESEGLSEYVGFCRSDICDLKELEDESIDLVVAEGDPLSCCESPRHAMRAVRRVLKPGGIFVASVDNKLACIEHFFQKNDLQGLQRLLRDGKTQWLTDDPADRFELTTFAPEEIESLFVSSGFSVLGLIGKTVLPVREYKRFLEEPQARKMLLRTELQLNRRRELLGRASHLEIAGAKR